MTLKDLIYVVDDELLLAQIMEAILQLDGHAVKMFTDPAAAFEAFQAEFSKPALLVTDFVMQPFDGLELIERCRNKHPSLRSLMVSANVGADILETSHGRPDIFLPKPFLPRVLINEVNSLLARDSRP
jgi:DNA-binding response OmpR family regulator